MSEFAAFAAAERAGWADAERASGYVTLFADTSGQAIAPLLDAAAVVAGSRVLDLCCGHGNVAQALVAKGCKVTGADFSPVMLALARQRVAGATFIEADAEHLPFAYGLFDAVVSNFGVCHVPDQPRALAEAHRVLKPGGRFAMSVWCGPSRCPTYQMFFRVLQRHGASGVAPPPAPDFHQFADRDRAHALLSDAGFSQFDQTIVETAWTMDSPDHLFEILTRGTLRPAMFLASQPAAHLAAIRSALAEEVHRYFAHGKQWRVPAIAAVVSATA